MGKGEQLQYSSTVVSASSAGLSLEMSSRRRPGPKRRASSARVVTKARAIRGTLEQRAVRFIKEIGPLRVHALNQPDFPRPLPFLQLLLALDSRFHRFKKIVEHEQFDAVFFCEPFDKPLAMLGHTAEDIAGHADVERSVSTAGEDVHAGLFHADDRTATHTLRRAKLGPGLRRDDVSSV